jgi:hypothetical protein
LPTCVFSQEEEIQFDRDQISTSENNNDEATSKQSIKDRIDTEFEVGTSFSYSPGNFYGPSYYIAPSISYLASPRFMLTTGAGLQYSTFYPLYQSSEPERDMLPMTRAFLFTRGSYFISPRLIVSGTVYKSISNIPEWTRNSGVVGYNYQGMSVGFQYRVSKSFSFGIHMNMQNGYYKLMV